MLGPQLLFLCSVDRHYAQGLHTLSFHLIEQGRSFAIGYRQSFFFFCGERHSIAVDYHSPMRVNSLEELAQAQQADLISILYFYLEQTANNDSELAEVSPPKKVRHCDRRPGV